ncbi:FecR domain-containing protein [Halosquirtibacter xylanolyticus]|uniref:FecR family protein n=1 Tax=Halosquirtibacter xylanolyticus TaxID=3374599 RepID=UPI0037498FA3|nr:FecR domain-containing protein [Prolixibacteraceae bacterium]
MKNIDEILAKHFSQCTTAEEEEILSQWRLNNEETYKQLSTIMKETQYIDYSDLFDPQEGWEEVSSKMNLKEAKVTGKVRNLWFRNLSIAASIVMVLSLGLWQLFSSHEKVIRADQMMTYTLPDHTKVILKKNSELKFNKTFADDRRDVSLKGDAFFEVEKDSSRPFTIHLAETKVTVLGTSFNIMTERSDAIVVVRTGRVAFESKDHQKVILTPGDRGVYRSQNIIKSINKDPNYMSWVTKDMDFKNCSLLDVFDKLEEVYMQKLSVQGDFSDMFVTIHFKDQTLQETLDELAILFDLKVVSNGSRFIVVKKDEK